MGTVGKISVDIVARTGGFSRGMKRATRDVRSFRASMSRGMAVIGKYARRAAIATIAAATASVYLYQRELQAIDATSKLAQSIGDTTENLLRMRHAGKLAGTSMETIDKSLMRMSARLGEAKIGVGEATDALAHLNLPVEELIELKPSEAIMKLADAISMLDTQAEKASIIKDIFGRGGQELMVLLDSGTEGIKQMGDRLSQSAIYTLKQARSVEVLNDQLTDLGATIRGELTRAVIGTVDYGSVLLDRLSSARDEAWGLLEVLLLIGGAAKEIGIIGAEIKGVLDFGNVAMKAGKKIGKAALHEGIPQEFWQEFLWGQREIQKYLPGFKLIPEEFGKRPYDPKKQKIIDDANRALGINVPARDPLNAMERVLADAGAMIQAELLKPTAADAVEKWFTDIEMEVARRREAIATTRAGRAGRAGIDAAGAGIRGGAYVPSITGLDIAQIGQLGIKPKTQEVALLEKIEVNTRPEDINPVTWGQGGLAP